MQGQKKILVTGGAGYVGDCVIDHLVKDKLNKIYVVDKLLYSDEYTRSDVEFKRMDIISPEFLDFVKKEKFDAIINLAAIVGEQACDIIPFETIKVNEVAVKDLCGAIKQVAPHTRFIQASTCSVYGSSEELLNEESQTRPLGLYASTKLNAEKFVKELDNHVIFRLATLYGLSAPFGRFRTDLVVNVLVTRASEGQKLVVIGGQQWRPLTHVQDVGRIFGEAATSNYTGMYILGNENFKVIDIAKMVDELVDASGGIEIMEANLNDLRYYRIDNAKSLQQGITMRHTLKDGIESMKNFLKEGRIKNIWHKKYDNAKHIKETLQYE